LDFIIKLLLSKEILTRIIYDLILVIINRLIKYAYFISYKESSTAEKLVYIFNRNIIINYGISEEIISDRNKLFISNF
jgi:hypothetical protein